MEMNILPYVLLIVFLSLVAAENPSIRVRVTAKGLDYANKLAGKYLEMSLTNRKIERFQTPLDASGNANLTVTNLDVSDFETPNLKYELLPPKNLAWGSKGGKMIVGADWAIDYDNGLIAVSGSGKFKATVDDLDFRTAAEIISQSNEQPKIQFTNCSANMNSIDIEISGGMMAWLLRKFRKTINAKVSELLSSTLCAKVKMTAEKIANDKLKVLPMMVPLSRNYILQYQLINHMVVTDTYLELQHRGEISWGGMRAIPYEPIALPESDRSDHMIMIWISQYVANSFFHSAHQQGLFRIRINRQYFPDWNGTLATSCRYGDDCIGFHVRPISRAAPNTYVTIDLASAAPPMCTIVRGTEGPKVNGTVNGVVSVAEDPQNVRVLFTFDIVYTSYLSVWIRQGKVGGEMNINRFSIENVNSTIGRISSMDLLFLESAIQHEIEAGANAMIQPGIVIPALDVVKYEYPDIKMDRKSVFVKSDLYYRPI